MQKRSNHYGDVQKWVEKVINSCETYEQYRSARRLIWNFESQMEKNKVNGQIRFSIGHHLRLLLSDKHDEIIKKRLEV